MNSDLETYLQDHVAGASTAINVISLLLEHSKEPVLTNVLKDLLIEVQEDKGTLERLAASMNMAPSCLKDSAAWVGARIVTWKTRAGERPFGAFEGLEFLCLGIQGKLHLWRALQRSGTCARAGTEPDFEPLVERALAQHRKVDALRLDLATVAL